MDGVDVVRALAIAATWLLLCGPLSAAAVGPSSPLAAAGIQRCETGDGTPVYTDRDCASLGARRTPLSHDLLLRIAFAGAPAVGTLSARVYRDASDPLESGALGRRSPLAGCARSPRQLTADLIGAFALGDVNRLAESYHWVGVSHRQSTPVMRQLERLVRQPLVDARFLAAWIASGDGASVGFGAAAADGPPVAGLMQLAFAGGDARLVDFQVRRYLGCYFVTF